MGSIAKLIVAIGADMSEFNKEMGKLKKSVDQVSEKLKNAGAGLTAGLSLPILGVGAASLKAASDMETLGVSFKVMLRDGKKGEAFLKDLAAFTARTPFQLEGVGQAGKQLLAFGFTAKDTMKHLQTLGDIAAGSGNDIGDLSAIFGQVSAAGKLTGERFNQLAERGIPVGKALAESMGVAESSVKDLVSKGVVGFDDFQKAMEGMTTGSGLFVGAMDQQSNTLAGLLSTIKDNLALAGAEMGNAIVATFNLKEIMASLIVKIQSLITWFKTLSPTAQKTIIVIASIAAAIGPLLFIIGKIAPAFTQAFSIIVPATQRAMASISASISSTGVGALVVALGIAVALIIANWDELKAYFSSGGGSKIWEQVQTDFNKAWEGIKQAAVIIVDVIQGIFSGLGVSLKINFEMFTGIILNIWTAWKTTMLNNVKTMVDLILVNVLRMVNLIKNIIGLVQAIANGEWKQAWEFMKDIVQDQVGFVVKMLQILVDNVLGVAESIASIFGKSIGDAVGDARDSVKDFGDALQEAIGSKTVKQVQQISNDIFDVDLSLQDATDSVEDFGDAGAKALDKVAGAVGAVSERVKDLVKEMKPISRDMEMGIGIQGGDREKPAAIEDPEKETQEEKKKREQKEKLKGTVKGGFGQAAAAGFAMAAQAASEFAKVITSRMEHFGGAFDAAMAGDPIGVVVSIFSEFADASTVFTGFMDRLNESLGTVITDLMPLFDGLFTQMEPLIPVITQMATTMSEFAFKTIARLLPPFMDLVGIAMLLLDIFMIWMDPLTMMAAMIAELVVQILIPLLPIFEMIVRLAVLQLAPAFVVLVVAMKILVPIITLLAQGLEILLDAIMSVANKLIDLINKIGGKFGMGELSIPALAAGGVVNGPTIAMIGEAGPEAVLPLSTLGNMIGGGGSLTTSVSGTDLDFVMSNSSRTLDFAT